MISKKLIYFPLTLLLSFLILSELLVFFGPIFYKLEKPVLLFSYLVIVNIALYLGYKRGIKSYRYCLKEKKTDTLIINIIILLGFIIAPINLVFNWGLESFSLDSVLDKLLLGLSSPAEVYSDYLVRTNNTKNGIGITIFFALVSPITYSAIPLGINYWKRIDRLHRMLLIFLIMMEIIYWLGIGTRKGLLDLTLIVSLLLIANNINLLQNKKIRLKIFLSVFIFFGIFLVYFVYSNLSRFSIDIKDLENLNFDNYLYPIKPFYEKHVSPLIYMPLATISDYLCQGYYALSCALKLSFTDPVFSYGSGNNTFTMMILDRLYGYPIEEQWKHTYQGVLYLHYGIDPLVNWHTIYVWLANDFTFMGVPIIIYFIGYFFSRSWLDTVLKTNIFATPLFYFFSIMVFYFFANNQILSSSFVGFFVIWGLYTYRKKIISGHFKLKNDL